jgi:hypothetical protein
VETCCKIIISACIWLCSGFLLPAKAQDTLTVENDTIPVLQTDSLTVPVPELRQSARQTLPEQPAPLAFKPNPKRAVIFSALCPGLGQIYNHKYWKLPIVYGGYMGFIYAITWNNKNYRDYSQAYFDISKDDPNDPDNWHGSWISFVPAGREPSEYILDSNFKSRLKNGKDFYRRYRDLSIILTAGWYLICMADAYVDAQLFDFDISSDLSLRITPVISPATRYNDSQYGLTCNIKF